MEIDAGPRPLRNGTTVMTGWLTESDPAGERRLHWLTFWFYVGVPLLLGFLLGWLQVGRAVSWPRSISLAYWIVTALLSTSILGATTHALAPLLRRWRSPLWLTLLIGQVIGGSLVVGPVLQGWRALLGWVFHPSLSHVGVGPLSTAVQTLPSNAVLWIGLNLLFFHGLQMPRFGYVPWAVPGRAATCWSPLPAADLSGGPMAQAGVAAELSPPSPAPSPQTGPVAATATTAVATAPSSTLPAFLGRVRPERRGKLLALQSDGHYLRVHTSAGSDLVLYRLSDAIRELGAEEGAQVHRSWWVAGTAVSGERHREVLKLVNGLEVPVSRSFRLVARERGWLLGSDSPRA